jgi:hypothetical protein
MSTTSHAPTASSGQDKTTRLRAAYAEFHETMQAIRRKRLDYMKSAFQKRDAQQIEDIKSQLSE